MVSDVKPGHPSFLMTGNCDGVVVPARGSTGEDWPSWRCGWRPRTGATRVLRTMVKRAGILPDE